MNTFMNIRDQDFMRMGPDLIEDFIALLRGIIHPITRLIIDVNIHTQIITQMIYPLPTQ